MTKSIRTLLVLLFIPHVIFGIEENFIGQNCSTDEIKALRESLNLTENPISSFLKQGDVTDECKNGFLGDLGHGIWQNVANGLCLDNWCEPLFEAQKEIGRIMFINETDSFCTDQEPLDCSSERSSVLPGGCFECVLNPDKEAKIKETDALVGEILTIQIETIEDKISAGLIPYCLLPKECHAPGQACQKKLESLWWNDLIFEKGTREYSLPEGGFMHLLLAQAFTCNTGKQEGGTCSIYSATNLMNHYCSTPVRNPKARPDTCVRKGPDFECPSPEEFLQVAYEEGAWNLDQCKGGVCHPIKINPADQTYAQQEENARLKTQYQEAWQTNECSISQPQQKTYKICQELKLQYARSQQLLQEAAQETLELNNQGFPSPLDPTRQSGVEIEKLVSSYETFGFDPILFEPTKEGATEMILSVVDGHPVQIGAMTQDWFDYKGSNGAHAVMVIGYWQDHTDKSRMMILDSNFPGEVQIFLFDDFLKSYFMRGKTGLGLCTSSDQREICQ